jgi:hypothetical protein
MKVRYVDLILLVAIVVGGVLVFQTGRERSRLQNTYDRLARKTGDLEIANRAWVHVQAIDTGDPTHFAWRVYLPPNYSEIVRSSLGSQSQGSTTDARELMARVRFREDEKGLLEVYTHFSNSSSRTFLGDQRLAKFLRAHWDKIRVEQLGSGDVVAIPPDGTASLLRLTLPEEIQSEAREELSPDVVNRFVPVLYEIELGPPKSSR